MPFMATTAIFCGVVANGVFAHEAQYAKAKGDHHNNVGATIQEDIENENMETPSASLAATTASSAALEDPLAFLSDMDGVFDDINAVLDAADLTTIVPDSANNDVEDATAQLLNDMVLFGGEYPLQEAHQLQSEDIILPQKDKHGGGGQVKTNVPSVATEAKKSTTRARQKAEMEYLRAQVVELESELAQLKSGADASPSASPSSVEDASTSISEDRAVVDAVWEKVAKRQHDQRHQAELKNIKLRELLEGQLRLARSLEKLLRKRSPDDSDAMFTERKRLRFAPVDDIEFQLDEIRLRIHQMFGRVDAVMQEAGLTTETAEMDDVRAKRDDHNSSIYMEMVMTRVLPFPLASVREALWECLATNRIDLENGYYSAKAKSDTMSDLEFATRLFLRKSEAIVRVRGVGARHHEPHRSMLVFENVGVAEGSLFVGEHLSIREEGYIEMTGYPSTAIDPMCTMLKSCLRLWPSVASDRKEDYHPQTGRFVDLVIGSYTQNVAAIIQLIENALLSQMTR